METTNCVPAKAMPLTAITGHTSSIRRKPDITVTSMAGMMRANSGVWRPTICESSRVSSPATLAPVRIGYAEPAERDRRRVREKRQRRRVEGLEAEPGHQGGRDGDRRPEAGRRLQERPEDEGDKHHLYPPVVAHAGERVADGVEVGPCPR